MTSSSRSFLELPLFQVDSFSGRVFGGNPAAVCVLGDVGDVGGDGDESWPDARLMQAVAEENNLAETVFCVKVMFFGRDAADHF